MVIRPLLLISGTVVGVPAAVRSEEVLPTDKMHTLIGPNYTPSRLAEEEGRGKRKRASTAKYQQLDCGARQNSIS